MEIETLHTDLGLGIGGPMFYEDSLEMLSNQLEAPMFVPSLDGIPFDYQAFQADDSFDYNQYGDLGSHTHDVAMNGTVPGSSVVLEIAGLPDKTRVETQMKMYIRLLDMKGNKITKFPCLRLQDTLIADRRRKLNIQKKKEQEKLAEISQTNAVLVMVAQVMDSTGTHTIHRCEACVKRERKALERRLKSKLPSENAGTELDTEKEKILQFYCESFVDFSAGEATFPIRITCYCRHHKERNGFGIKLSLYNMSTGALVVESTSPLVLVTDDHKSSPTSLSPIIPHLHASLSLQRDNFDGDQLTATTTTTTATNDNDYNHNYASGNNNYNSNSNSANYTTMNHNMHQLQDPTGENEPIGELPNPIRSPRDSIGSPNQNISLTSNTSSSASSATSISCSPSSVPSGSFVEPTITTTATMKSVTDNHSMGVTPMNPAQLTLLQMQQQQKQQQLQMQQQLQQQQLQQRQQALGPQYQQMLLQQYLLQQQQQQQQQQRFPEDLNGYRNIPNNFVRKSSSLDSNSASNKRQRIDDASSLFYSNNYPLKYEPPEIDRLIPASGPISGGIEVTILGKSFRSGLNCLFGPYEAPITQLYGPTTLVAILPAALAAGPVVVSLKDIQTEKVLPNNSDVVFTYINNVDRKLLELALQVIGMQLTGKIEDPNSIALKIVSETQQGHGQRQGVQGKGNNSFDASHAGMTTATTTTTTNDLVGSEKNGHDAEDFRKEGELNAEEYSDSVAELVSSLPFTMSNLAYFISSAVQLDMQRSNTSKIGNRRNNRSSTSSCSRHDECSTSGDDDSTESDTENFPTLDLSLQDETGHQLLHYAVMLELDSLVDVLLAQSDHLIDVDLPDKNGWTALHFASFFKLDRMIAKLLSRGASTQIPNENGDLPLTLSSLYPTIPRGLSLLHAVRSRSNSSNSERDSDFISDYTSYEDETYSDSEVDSDEASASECVIEISEVPMAARGVKLDEGVVGLSEIREPDNSPADNTNSGVGVDTDIINNNDDITINRTVHNNDNDTTATTGRTPIIDTFDEIMLGKARTIGELHLLVWWGFAMFLLAEFWENYRVFLYIGLLAATGSWTLMDYIPRLTGIAPSPPTIVVTKGIKPYFSFCNPPSPYCADPDYQQGHNTPTVPTGTVEARSIVLKPELSALAIFLNFGQYLLFVLFLFLIIYHYKETLGPVRFWVLFSVIFLLWFVGALFIFNVFGNI